MPLGDSDNPFDLIVIGRGSAAAYFLQSMPRIYKSFKDDKPVDLSILVIGEGDPWAGARGNVPETYGQNINQAKQVLGHNSGSTANTSQGPQDRREWAKENKTILDKMATEIVTGIVTRVSKVPKILPTDRQRFKVDARSAPKTEYFGNKIVIATGAGIEDPQKGHKDYHAVPPEVSGLLNNAAVMNLDKFMKMPKNSHDTSKKIAILGPTAGTDAVMQAGTLGYSSANVYWLMRREKNTAGFQNVYPGNDGPSRDKITQIKKDSENRILAFTVGTLTVTAAPNNQIQINCTPIADSPVRNGRVTVDLFVYSTGQTPANTLTAPPDGTDPTAQATEILDGPLKTLLEPIYDVNQRLGEQGSSSGPWQHVTGLQLQESNSATGLMIIGAATFQVAADVDHNFLQFDFQNLLAALKQYPEFEQSARSWFPELLQPLTLSQPAQWPANVECQTKQNSLVTNWQNYLTQNSARYDQVPQGERAKWISDRIKDAKHLCYLFQQRAEASRYLAGANRTVRAMLQSTNTLPEALQDCRLLSGIAANVNAMNASSPKSMAKKTDLNKLDFQVNYLESATELRCYISAHYPKISEVKAQEFINNVTTQRKSKGNMGFELYEIVDFELALESLNKKSKTLY